MKTIVIIWLWNWFVLIINTFAGIATYWVLGLSICYFVIPFYINEETEAQESSKNLTDSL